MKEINIMVGRFQPLTNGHLSCVETAYKKLGIPTVLCMIGVDENKIDEKHPFPTTLLEPLYKEILGTNKMIEDIIIIKSADIVKISEILYDKGYVIRSWTCGTDRYIPYKKMADKYAEQAKLHKDMEVIEIHRNDDDVSATQARVALKTGDKTGFNKLVPINTLKSRLKGNSYYDVLKKWMDEHFPG
jgi:hypothetical protein